MDEEIKKHIVKTGTTTLGIVCRDGVVMAADRQATLGERIIHNKNAKKILPVNDYTLMGIAGGAADAVKLSKLLAAELRLKELRSKSRPTIGQVANLAANISYSSIRQPAMIPFVVGTLIGGINENNTIELYTIIPDGSIEKVEDYDANIGSGMPYVLGLLERQYKKDISVKEGVELAKEALKSSTQRDVGSGYGIDVFTITKEGIKKVVEQTIKPDYKDDKEK